MMSTSPLVARNLRCCSEVKRGRKTLFHLFTVYEIFMTFNLPAEEETGRHRHSVWVEDEPCVFHGDVF